MSSKLIKVDKENLNLAWEHAAPYLEKALSLSPEYSLMDVHHLIKTGEITLWYGGS